MAIAFDTATNENITTASSITFSHTCTGSDLILFVGATIDFADQLTGITYNTVALTQVGKIQQPSSGRWTYLYYLVGPATGTHDVVCSASGSVLWLVYSASYTGAKQTTQLDNSVTQSVASTGTGNNAFTLTVNTADSWMVMGGAHGAAAATAGANTVARGDSTSHAQGFWDTNSAQATGDRDLNLDFDNNNVFAGVQASFKPAAGPAKHFSPFPSHYNEPNF